MAELADRQELPSTLEKEFHSFNALIRPWTCSAFHAQSRAGVDIMLGAIAGGVASDIWQAIRQAKSDPTSTSSTGTSSTGSASVASTATASTATSATAPPSPGDAANKLISDVNSLLLSLQSGSASSGTSSTTSSATTDAANAVQSDLNTLASAQSNGGQSKVGGHGHHHHRPPEAIDSDATGNGTSTASASGNTAADKTLIDAVAKAIKAYTASSSASTQTTAAASA